MAVGQRFVSRNQGHCKYGKSQHFAQPKQLAGVGQLSLLTNAWTMSVRLIQINSTDIASLTIKVLDL